MGNEILTIMKILEKLEHIKNQGVIFWSEGKRPLVVWVFDQLVLQWLKPIFFNKIEL
jgi:hypothetical protein